MIFFLTSGQLFRNTRSRIQARCHARLTRATARTRLTCRHLFQPIQLLCRIQQSNYAWTQLEIAVNYVTDGAERPVSAEPRWDTPPSDVSPTVLFERSDYFGGTTRAYDISPDEQRCLMIKDNGRREVELESRAGWLGMGSSTVA